MRTRLERLFEARRRRDVAHDDGVVAVVVDDEELQFSDEVWRALEAILDSGHSTVVCCLQLPDLSSTRHDESRAASIVEADGGGVRGAANNCIIM